MRWLSDFVKVDAPIKQYAADLTMSGSKVEGYETEGAELSRVVVGKVLEITKHPGADTLYITQVDVGGDAPVQIVTGADNVVAGALVPVALDGSTLVGGKTIKKGKLRGEVSNGMLCSLEELGLTLNDFPYAKEDGIFLLEEDCAVGQDIQSAIGLNDTVVEFEITPNRPDCLSVIGLARETAATYHIPCTIPQPKVKGSGGGNIADVLSVEVLNPQLCFRYSAAAVKNVRIAPSPRWLRERLRASGVRPINNIVDITNYVMLEYGHPMHAFDLKHVQGAKIVVRNAREGEKITTLDGVERSLSPEMLVIADEKDPSAVAGVMGGEFSGIYDDTETVIFEAACFLGASVRTTAKKLGMRTESSGRFEKGLDPETCMPALRRACELVELLDAGDVVAGFADVYPTKRDPVTLRLDAPWISAFLGVEIPEAEMTAILRELEFTVEGGMVTPPSFRADVQCQADLAEEIARIHGYNNLPSTALRGAAEGKLSEEQKLERTVNRVLLGQGLSEISTYSFISPKYYDKFALPEDSFFRRSVVIRNPLGEDTRIMRTTPIPSMLEILAHNYRNRNAEAALYEIATVYRPTTEDQLPTELKNVVLGMYGGDNDFFVLKGAVEMLLERAGVQDYEFMAVSDDASFHPGRCAYLHIAGAMAGVLGEIHPAVADNYEVGTRMYAACIDFATLLAGGSTERSFKPLPRYPASTRDLALTCDDKTPVGKIESAIREAVGGILEELSLFDVYRGAQVGEGKKSVAYSLVLRAADRTLTDQECDAAVKRILKALAAIGVELRA